MFDLGPESVSIIIPCYRQGRFLAGAIESVLNQSHTAVEPVVVNDGSDDETDDVARRFGDRITYVCQPNRGLSAARNAGLRVSQSKYVLFLDADDLLHPEVISWHLEALEGREDTLSIVGVRSFYEHPFDEEQPPWMPPELPSLLPRLLYGNFSPPLAHMCSRRLVERVNLFDESLHSHGHADWNLWLQMALNGARLTTIRRVGAFYRRHPESMSACVPSMRESRVETVARIHNLIVDDSALLNAWGETLLIVEHGLLRSCLAHQMARCHWAPLERGICELRQRGIRMPQSFPKKMLDSLFGVRGEQLCVLYFRLFERKTFRQYLRV